MIICLLILTYSFPVHSSISQHDLPRLVHHEAQRQCRDDSRDLARDRTHAPLRPRGPDPGLPRDDRVAQQGRLIPC